MTEISNRPVDNGDRFAVECSFFRGVAGVRQSGNGGEFACMASPRTLRKPVLGTVDGRPVTILDLRKSTIVAGMQIAQFEYVEGV